MIVVINTINICNRMISLLDGIMMVISSDGFIEIWTFYEILHKVILLIQDFQNYPHYLSFLCT